MTTTKGEMLTVGLPGVSPAWGGIALFQFERILQDSARRAAAARGAWGGEARPPPAKTAPWHLVNAVTFRLL